MPKEDMRKVVLDFLYRECMSKSKDMFVIRRKMTCKLEAGLKYDHLSNSEKNKIYKQVKNS